MKLIACGYNWYTTCVELILNDYVGQYLRDVTEYTMGKQDKNGQRIDI